MELKKAAELSTIVSALGTVYCCFVATYTITHPPQVSTPGSVLGNGVDVMPHLTALQISALVVFAVVALGIIAAAVLNYLLLHKPEAPVSTGQGKPKWQKLEWANTERARLEAENARLVLELARAKTVASELQALANEARDAFSNPKWEIVDDQTFKNVTVELDGKKFWRCKFQNVTLMFHGKAPVEFAVGNEFKPEIKFVTDHPAAMLFANLLQMFRKVGEISGRVTTENMVDSSGKAFPDNFSVYAQTPMADPGATDLGSLSFSPLQVRALGLAKELHQFKNNFEPCPTLTPLDGSNESFENKLRDKRVLLEPWQDRLGHAYASMFSRRVTDLIHELGAQGFDVSSLEPYGKLVGSMDNVNNAIKALWKLAQEMEFK